MSTHLLVSENRLPTFGGTRWLAVVNQGVGSASGKRGLAKIGRS